MLQYGAYGPRGTGHENRIHPMTTITSYRPGTFCWVELSTSDGPAAKDFYTRLFGWTTNDIPIGDGMVYVMFQKDGKNVGAMFENKDAPHPVWASYVSVESADDAMAKAKSLGATVIAEPMQVGDSGRMAVFADPQGAVLGLWQAANHIGASVIKEPGSLTWNELGTTDDEAARAFYSALFGWRMEQVSFGEPYTIIYNGDEQAGGLYNLVEYQAEMPPNWAPYFAVTNTDESLEQARSLVVQVVMDPKDVPGVGRFALLSDPQGAYFYVLQPV
ncbi:MAG: glyoxalase [Acidobacteria bacterium]|nr:glyoxalase [Acidobacteriota bacterium]